MLLSSCMQAYTALNNAQSVGQRAMKLTYLELYPGETMLKGRLGQLIWETYSAFEADFANISSAKVWPLNMQLANITLFGTASPSGLLKLQSENLTDGDPVRS
jgi:hypothetical protein